ncbi:hypothetical protein AVEN_151612-1 [Araneus ventricosus]|uniref:Uncharacterized protein n=1 Tax=Araneus ventricosus TaxID=182803 RepID=A0A4Y2UEF6_ARAVE|nr:hypothetical protein AVEN_151612-1 [Araneus ventricosus]
MRKPTSTNHPHLPQSRSGHLFYTSADCCISPSGISVLITFAAIVFYADSGGGDSISHYGIPAGRLGAIGGMACRDSRREEKSMGILEGIDDQENHVAFKRAKALARHTPRREQRGIWINFVSSIILYF